MKLEFSATAARRLNEIYNFIAKDSERAAATFISVIITKSELIAMNPFIGKETVRPEVREFVIHKNYKLIYKAAKDVLTVIYIKHNKTSFEL